MKLKVGGDNKTCHGILVVHVWCENATNGVFSHDVRAAMLVSQNKEMAAMLVSQTKPLGIEHYFYENTFFCFSKPIWPVIT